MKENKKFAATGRANRATMEMFVRAENCGNGVCANPPVVRIGDKLFCDACLKQVQINYPASYKAYWEPKAMRL